MMAAALQDHIIQDLQLQGLSVTPQAQTQEQTRRDQATLKALRRNAKAVVDTGLRRSVRPLPTAHPETESEAVLYLRQPPLSLGMQSDSQHLPRAAEGDWLHLPLPYSSSMGDYSHLPSATGPHVCKNECESICETEGGCERDCVKRQVFC